MLNRKVIFKKIIAMNIAVIAGNYEQANSINDLINAALGSIRDSFFK